MQDTLCIYTLRSHDGTMARGRSSRCTLKYTLVARRALVCTDHFLRMNHRYAGALQGRDDGSSQGSEDRTISCYPVRMHLCSSHLKYNYITRLYLGCTSADCFILSKVLPSFFLFSLGICYFFR